MEKNKQNILIVGRGSVPASLAKKLAAKGEIFVAPGDNLNPEIYTSVDIREDDLTGLLKFVLENNITLTIPVSEKALKADIVSFFSTNGQKIFGPSKQACNIAINKSAGKKFLYKIHAQTQKFGVFDKYQQAQDYLKSVNFPVTIKCSEYDGLDDRLVCSTIGLADEFLGTLFSKGETNILIEEYAFGHNFTIYFITDGYSALPLTSVMNYKFMQDGEGGIYTNGMGCFAPDYTVSGLVVSRVENIVRNTLISLDKKGSPYVGILGVECTMTGDDKFYVNEFKPFLQDYDATAVLNLIDDDLVSIFNACIEGLFADEYEHIVTNNASSVSAVVLARRQNQVISGLSLLEDISNVDFIDVRKVQEDYFTKSLRAFVLTRCASTLSRAVRYLYDDISEIKFDGMKYRKDIGASVFVED